MAVPSASCRLFPLHGPARYQRRDLIFSKLLTPATKFETNVRDNPTSRSPLGLAARRELTVRLPWRLHVACKATCRAPFAPLPSPLPIDVRLTPAERARLLAKRDLVCVLLQNPCIEFAATFCRGRCDRP